MESRRFTPIIALFLVFLSACASGPKTMGTTDFDENNQGHGAAFLVDAVQPRKPMPSRPEWKPWKFYYKHCHENGAGYYYSRTSYECTDRYY